MGMMWPQLLQQRKPCHPEPPVPEQCATAREGKPGSRSQPGPSRCNYPGGAGGLCKKEWRPLHHGQDSTAARVSAGLMSRGSWWPEEGAKGELRPRAGAACSLCFCPPLPLGALWRFAAGMS